jgi:hypothetical protein
MTERRYPNPEIEASIAAKTDAAIVALAATGRDVSALTAEDLEEIAETIELTPEEFRYSGELEIHRMVCVEIGRRIVDTLNNNNCRVHRDDIIPCLHAYFESLEAIELKVVA